MNTNIRRLTATAALCAMAYLLVVFCRIPLVLFLEYEPKDVIITLGGFLWGPLTSLAVSVSVAAVELVTISEDGVLGFVMNVLSSCSFACTAAIIYQKRKNLRGAAAGLAAGSLLMIPVMLLWNCLITPIYMGYPREAVVALLMPAFLPFNLVKVGLNTIFILTLYGPVMSALRRSGIR